MMFSYQISHTELQYSSLIITIKPKDEYRFFILAILFYNHKRKLLEQK